MNVQTGHVYRHVKSGGTYLVLRLAKMQTASWTVDELDDTWSQPLQSSVDLADVVVYQSLHDQTCWVRPQFEFEDGRFVLV